MRPPLELEADEEVDEVDEDDIGPALDTVLIFFDPDLDLAGFETE